MNSKDDHHGHSSKNHQSNRHAHGRIVGILYVMTGSVAIGGVAAVLEPICNVILMPLHDRMWERIRARLEARQANSAAHPDAAAIRTT